MQDLSRREVEVLCLAARGLTAKEIGAELFLSHKTVKNHLSKIYRKLAVPNRVAAVRAGIASGVVPVDEPVLTVGTAVVESLLSLRDSIDRLQDILVPGD